MNAEREFLRSALREEEKHTERLALALERLRREVREAGLGWFFFLPFRVPASAYFGRRV